MPSIPCDRSIRCTDPENGFDSPITNYSSEQVDGVDYMGVKWPIIRRYDPYNRDPSEFRADSCLGVVTAPTQAEADLLAAINEYLCGRGDGVPPPPDHPTEPDTPDPVIYYNTPQFCTWTCPDGTQETYTVGAGYFVSSVSQAVADEKASAYACQQVARNRVCFGSLRSFACIDQLYDELLVCDVGPSVGLPITFTITSGALPPGLNLTSAAPAFPNSASVFGTPTATGSYSFTVKAVPAIGVTVEKSFTISVIGITNAGLLPDAIDGFLYSETLIGGGGVAPYTFSADPDLMPIWLVLADDGTLSGTPSAADVGITFEFPVTVTDAAGNSCQQTCSITVIAGCVPDTGPVPPLAQPSFLSADLTLPNWNSEKTGLVVPGADPPGVQPEWDGTLPVLDYATIPGTAFYMPTGGFFSDFAINGMLGVGGSITLSQGGAFGPWVLDMWVMVGGVPTQAWTGQKAVGSCGAGTYMRTGGASAGPDCFHVEGCAEAIAWWSMDTLPITKLSPDSITGRLFDFSTGAGLFATSVAGQVGNAVRVNSFGVASRYGIYQSADLSFGTVGFSIVCWVRVTYNVSSPGNNQVNLEYAFYVGGVQHIIAIVEVEGANWVVTLDGAPIGGVTKVFAGGWHFLALTYDATTGAIEFDIDQSGVSAGIIAAMVAESNPLSDLVVRVQTGLVGNTDGDFDELSLLDRVLTQEQLNWIYNAGAGRTWPI